MHRVCKDKTEYMDGLINGLLNEKEKADIVSHIENCEDCHSYYEEMTALKKSLSELSLKAPSNLNKRIMDAVKEQSSGEFKSRKKWNRPVYIASYAAAACLVLAFAFIFYQGGFNVGKNYESSEMLFNEEQSKSAGAERSENDGNLFADTESTNDEAAVVPMPEADREMLEVSQPGYTAKLLEEEGYKFNTSAFEGSNSITYNSDGIDLNDSYNYGSSQDILYLTANYSADEIADILYMDFNIKPISNDQKSIYVELPASVIAAVEVRLDLVASETVEIGKKAYIARIVSIDSE